MPVTWYEGVVESVLSLTDTTKQITLILPEYQDFSFVPGQFVTMDLPVGEKRLDRWRSYSIANAPGPSGRLEFCIVHLPGGLGSHYLCEEIKEGDCIRFKGPDGGFVLPDKVPGSLIFIATGTGLAPFRSMILELEKNPESFPDIHLIFGTRRQEDLLYHEYFLGLEQKFAGFRYTVALSRESKPGFVHGYVHEVYKSEHYVIPPHAQIYICGWSKMIDQAVEILLLEKKVNKEQVKFELYG